MTAAERGRKVVVLTIDPARRLAQSMGIDALDNTPRRVKGVDDSAGGDLHVMGGATQAGWEHSVPKLTRRVGGRISVQWRWTSRRGRPFQGASFRSPRHYSPEAQPWPERPGASGA